MRQLIDQCDILRFTESGRDGRNKPTGEWTVASTEACYLSGLSGAEGAGKIEATAYSAKIFLLAEADVTERDRIRVGEQIFSVKAVSRPRHHHTEVLVGRVQ